MKQIISCIFSVIILIGCSSKHKSKTVVDLTDKEKVVALLNSFATKDTQALQCLNPEIYVQHNLKIADGASGIKTLITNLPDGAKVNVSRVFQDGKYVFVHSEYYTSSHRIGFDIFRFDNGLIVEHWDNL
jgi:predicted SnoaL-like aldol condensation-catalyzing enzyme